MFTFYIAFSMDKADTFPRGTAFPRGHNNLWVGPQEHSNSGSFD